MRHVREEDDCFLKIYCPFKISNRQREREDDPVVTSEQVKSKRKFLHVVQKVWRELYAKDKDFGMSYKRKV